MQTKFCKSCQETKPIEEFTQSKNSFKYIKSQSHHSFCKKCNAIKARKWRQANPNYKGTGRLKLIPKEDRRLMSAIRQRLSDAKGRCKKLKKEAPVLTDTYLYELFKQQNRCCALTGVPLVIEPGHQLCLSLDQIEPMKGYIEGNVQWLAWCVNRAKGDLALDDFFDMCETILDRKVQRLSREGVEPSGSKRGTPAVQDEDIVCST